MKRILLTLILFIFFSNQGRGQKFSKGYIDWWLTKCDTILNIKDVTAYVVDGSLYLPQDSLKLNQGLVAWNNETFAGIDYLKIDKLPTAHNFGKYAVLITSKREITKKQKREFLRIARSKFRFNNLKSSHIPADSSDPVLIINDKQVFHAECYDELEKIRIRDIDFIHIAHSSVPSEYYGQNAKNGLVKIWTKKRL